MSSSPAAASAARSATLSQAIPTRRLLITDPAQMPDVYSSTPGGTLYGTTPGGTKIIYERSFLMTLRESPISKTPPSCSLPSGLLRGSPRASPPRSVHLPVHKRKNSRAGSIDEGCETFSMDL